MLRKLIITSAVLLSVAACASSTESKPVAVKSMQKNDKFMTCQEILLEMNEAEFYRKTAEKSRGPKLQNLLMPLGYISTYMSADDAIDASNVRVAYLDRIYQIMACDAEKGVKEGKRPSRDPAAAVRGDETQGALTPSAADERAAAQDLDYKPLPERNISRGEQEALKVEPASYKPEFKSGLEPINQSSIPNRPESKILGYTTEKKNG